jgi:hypothetical protein
MIGHYTTGLLSVCTYPSYKCVTFWWNLGPGGVNETINSWLLPN